MAQACERQKQFVQQKLQQLEEERKALHSNLDAYVDKVLKKVKEFMSHQEGSQKEFLEICNLIDSAIIYLIGKLDSVTVQNGSCKAEQGKQPKLVNDHHDDVLSKALTRLDAQEREINSLKERADNSQEKFNEFSKWKLRVTTQLMEMRAKLEEIDQRQLNVVKSVKGQIKVSEQAEKVKAEKEKAEKQNAEKEKVEKEKAEKEKAEKEKAEKEKAEKEKADKEKVKKEITDKEKVDEVKPGKEPIRLMEDKEELASQIRSLKESQHTLKMDLDLVTVKLATLEANVNMASCDVRDLSCKMMGLENQVRKHTASSKDSVDGKGKSEINILVIGKSGQGKSSTGNSILGSSVLAGACVEGSKSRSEIATAVMDGHTITVVDNRGIYECFTCDDLGFVSPHVNPVVSDAKKEQLTLAFSLCPKGFNAVLFVFKYGTKFSIEDQSCLKRLKQVLGDDFIHKFGVLVVTCGDLFEYNQKQNKKPRSFNEWIEHPKNDLRELYLECDKRAVMFYNSTTDKTQRTKPVFQLLEVIQKSKYSGQRLLYSR